jgi:hypothetical protein
MTADRKTAQKKCSGSLGHPLVQWVVGRESPVCAQWSRRQPLSGFRPEVEHVSTNLFGGSQGGISSNSTVVESF